MYLETTRAMGLPRPVWQAICPNDSVMAKRVVQGDGYRPPDLYSVCGGRKQINPPAPVKPRFKTAYNLVGTPPSQNWSYPACNAGYAKQQVNRPHPNMYSCFDPAELAWNKKNGIMF